MQNKSKQCLALFMNDVVSCLVLICMLQSYERNLRLQTRVHFKQEAVQVQGTISGQLLDSVILQCEPDID